MLNSPPKHYGGFASDFREGTPNRLAQQLQVAGKKGKETINGLEAFVVEAVAADSLAETMYLDRRTGLLIRRDITIQGILMLAYFEDHREVDGVKLPFTIRRVRHDFNMRLIIIANIASTK